MGATDHGLSQSRVPSVCSRVHPWPPSMRPGRWAKTSEKKTAKALATDGHGCTRICCLATSWTLHQLLLRIRRLWKPAIGRCEDVRIYSDDLTRANQRYRFPRAPPRGLARDSDGGCR